MGRAAALRRAATFFFPLWSWPVIPLRSAHRWREVGQGEISGVNLFGQFPIGFRFLLYTLPLRVVLERLPISGSLFATGMLQDVHQCVALLRFVHRCPISDAFKSMPVKDFYGVVTEAGQQFWQFSRGCMVDPEFVYHARSCLRIYVVLLCSCPN